MKSIFLLLKSPKFAVTLIILIIILSAISTFIPQRDAIADENGIRNLLRLNDFYSSIFFLFPVLLFVINLSVCTVNRVLKVFKTDEKKNFGPDMIHIGIIILIIASVLTCQFKREETVFVREGNGITFGDYRLVLKSFEQEFYEKGTTKSWISTVDFYEKGIKTADDFKIKINKPLKRSGFKIYQMSYYNNIKIKDENGNLISVESGDVIEIKENVLLFKGIEKKSGDEYKAVFNKIKDGKISGVVKTGENADLFGYTVTDLKNENISGLKISKDPGYVFVIMAVLFIMIGLLLNYYLKSKEKK